MATKPKYKSRALTAIHTSASALQKVGAINQTTMRKFDACCLAAHAGVEPKQIKKICDHANINQPVHK